MLKQGISKMAPTCQMSAELNYVQEPLSVLCGHECPVGGTFRVTVVCRIAVFLSSEELAEADGECHIPFNTLPSCQKANSFDFPSNHSTFLPSLPSTCVHIHTHTIARLSSGLRLIVTSNGTKPPPVALLFILPRSSHKHSHIHQCTIKAWNHEESAIPRQTVSCFLFVWFPSCFFSHGPPCVLVPSSPSSQAVITTTNGVLRD